jgi:hypothetical protein
MAKRVRFQIHLSTAVVLMFAAGGLMWANIRPWWYLQYSDYYRSEISIKAWGWPGALAIANEGRTEIQRSMIFFNLAAALMILLTVWFICEWRIRRKRTRVESENS